MHVELKRTMKTQDYRIETRNYNDSRIHNYVATNTEIMTSYKQKRHVLSAY